MKGHLNGIQNRASIGKYEFCKTDIHHEVGLLIVTNSYFGWITQYQSTTELLLASSQSISSLISGNDSSCSWVLVHALDLGEGRSSRL